MYLANHAVKQGDKSGGNLITETAVIDANKFTLAYNENTFSLEFSALDFNNPERISYQYMIDELGNECVITSYSIHYTKLYDSTNWCFHVDFQGLF